MIDTVLWAAFGVETLILLAVIGICVWMIRNKPNPVQGNNKVSGPQPRKDESLKHFHLHGNLPGKAPKGPPPKPATRHHITVEIDRGKKQ